MITPVFEWTPIDINTILSAEVTRGTFVIKDDNDKTIWGNEDFEWTWVEILEWLTLNWDSLHTPGSVDNPDNDLRSGLMGLNMPDEFIVWWDGEADAYFKICGSVFTVSASEWEYFLIQLGNLVSYRLNLVSDSRSKIVLADWRNIISDWEKNNRLPVLAS